MEEFKDLIIGLLCFGMGIWAIYASYKDLGSFFNSFKAKIVVSVIGRTGARLFYGALGLFLAGLSIKILYDYFTK